MTRSRRLPGAAGIAALVAICALTPPLGRAAEPVEAERRLVVAANPHAAEAGISILRAGGSAADAAIAVQLVLSLVEPQSSGVGGGAFALYLDAGGDAGGPGRITAYQGRERAPAAATPELFLDADGEPLSFFEAGFGGLAVGVPGVMRMLEQLHRDHGRLPWPDLFEPAIELAVRGFEISPRLYFLLDRFKNFAAAQAFREHYFDADGEPHPAGHRLVNLEYAATLELLAEQGAGVMYTGRLARDIVAAVGDNELRPGLLTLADLESYRAERLEPLCSPYREWRVCGPQPPSSGGVTVQQILGIVEHFDLAAADGGDAAPIHLIADASRLAFADRGLYLGDPDFVDVPVAGLLAPEYLRERAALISPERALTNVEPGRPALARAAWQYAPGPLAEVKSTSHFSIVDEWGDAVSMTTSVQSAFGSQLMVGGFLLNNQLTDFSFEPEVDGAPVANAPGPRKRPLSSMAPTIVLDEAGRLHLVIGSPGGTRIINFVAQAVIGVLDFGLNVQDAVAAPHFVAQDGPIELEERTELLELGDDLRALGHRVAPRNLNSGLHGIAVDHADTRRRLLGGVDPRREGQALGD